MSAYLSLIGRRRGGRLLTFSAFRMGAYSRWALIRGWALIQINSVFQLRGRERGVRLRTAIPLQGYITRLELCYKTLSFPYAQNLIKLPQNSKDAPNCKGYQKVAERLMTKAVISGDREPCTGFFIFIFFLCV